MAKTFSSNWTGFSLIVIAFFLGGFLQSLQLTVYMKHETIVENSSRTATPASGSNSRVSGRWVYREEQPQEQPQTQPLLREEEDPHREVPPRNITIFYNVYIPLEGAANHLDKAKSIIVEQIRQLAESHIFNDKKKRKNNVELRFVSIGLQETGPMILKECQQHQMKCVQLSHKLTGYEDQTLRHIYPFCLAHVNASNFASRHEHQIIYVHNKGSFHQDGEILSGAIFSGQDNWRRAMTDAVTSKQCEQGLYCKEKEDNCDTSQEATQCNVCGLLFQPLPHHHFPGNMFATTCDYVLKGYSYHDTEQRLRNMLNQMLLEGQYSTSLFGLAENIIGSGRFMAEYWIGNTPFLRPCDVAHQHNSLDYWRSTHPVNAVNSFRLSNAPTVAMADRTWDYHKYTLDRPIVKRDQSLRLRNFFLLPGNLFKWKIMYNQAPPRDSWVWSWYPDGSVFLNQIFGDR